MDTQVESEQKRLTIDDPVDAETRSRFTVLEDSRLRIGEHLLNLELERVKLIRAASAIDTERQKVFERVLIERGLSPSQPFSIDSETGQIKPITQEELDAIRSSQKGAPPTGG
jgi:hypothetical protein